MSLLPKPLEPLEVLLTDRSNIQIVFTIYIEGLEAGHATMRVGGSVGIPTFHSKKERSYSALTLLGIATELMNHYANELYGNGPSENDSDSAYDYANQ